MAETYSRPIRVPSLSWVLKKPATFNELRSQATCDEREKTGGGNLRPKVLQIRPLRRAWIPACRQAGKVPRTCGVWWVKGAKKAKSNFLKKISSAHVARNILFRNRWITNFSNLLLKWTLKLGPLKRQFIELRTEAEHFKNPIVWLAKTFSLRRF